MPTARQTTARFGPDLYGRLILAADCAGLPLNSVIIVACMEWMEQHYPRIASGTDAAVFRFPDNSDDPSTAASRACSFCGKDSVQITRLIAGPGGVAICNECIDLCNGIIAKEDANSGIVASQTEP